MGAYGSPELSPPQGNAYDNTFQKKDNPKGSNCFVRFLKGLLITVGALSTIFVVIAFIIGNRPTAYKNASAPVYSQQVYVPPAAASSAPAAPVVIDDSTDYLQSIAKKAVLKALLYPDSAKFSDEVSDWKIVRDGNVCEIDSIVTSRGKKKNEIINGSFIVKITFYDELIAKVTYISIDDQVWYDASKSNSSKSK